jgi:30S ribosomal protein S31
MGKGDRKTAKGKRNISSYGKSRPNVSAKATTKAVVTKTSVATTKAPAVKKAPAKKVAAK